MRSLKDLCSFNGSSSGIFRTSKRHLTWKNNFKNVTLQLQKEKAVSETTKQVQKLSFRGLGRKCGVEPGAGRGLRRSDFKAEQVSAWQTQKEYLFISVWSSGFPEISVSMVWFWRIFFTLFTVFQEIKSVSGIITDLNSMTHIWWAITVFPMLCWWLRCFPF